MALTDLQKHQNKAAQRVRDQAHAARLKLFRQAVEAAENSPEVISARAALDEATALQDQDSCRREVQISDLEAQIAKLKAQISMLKTAPERDALNEQRQTASGVWWGTRCAKVLEAEASFPDLQGTARHSAAAWQPPQDVLDAMEQARSSASLPSKANGTSSALV